MDKTLSRDGTSIAYRRRGEGPPVILVGGALSTAETEAPLAALLAPRFTVVTYDRRGRGSSGDNARYAIRREIEDLAAVAGRAGERVSVFGMLSGGALALEAQAAGLPIDMLAVYEPPYTPDASGLLYKARCTARLHRLLSIGDRGGAVELYLSRTGVPDATIARMQQAPRCGAASKRWRTPWRTTTRSWATERSRPSGSPPSRHAPWPSAAASAPPGPAMSPAPSRT